MTAAAVNPSLKLGQHQIVKNHIEHLAGGVARESGCGICIVRDDEDLADGQLDAVIDAFLDVAAALWRIGDGYGGHVLGRVHERAMQKGLPVGRTSDRGVFARSYVAKAIRAAIAERDGGEFCQFCGDTELLEIDHKWPVSRGGTSDLENLHFLCHGCNKRKKSTPWHDFLAASGRVS